MDAQPTFKEIRRSVLAGAFNLLLLYQYADKEVAACDLADHAIKLTDLLTERLDHYPEGLFSGDNQKE